MNQEILKSIHLIKIGDKYRIQAYKEKGFYTVDFIKKENCFKYAISLGKKFGCAVIIHGDKCIEHVYKC